MKIVIISNDRLYLGKNDIRTDFNDTIFNDTINIIESLSKKI
tara:strand:+ start:265 stop:390 length:126 start_codon:yes stop_codon:yes gene_type:complete